MTSHQFTFPPPPPPPPPQAYYQPNNTQGNGYGERESRGDRDNRGPGHRGVYGRHSGGGDNGGFRNTSAHRGYSPRNEGQFPPSNGPYPGQVNRHPRNSYPLPEYPPIQQPQYSSTPQNAYSHSLPQYPTTVAPLYSSPPVYTANQPQNVPYHSTPTQNTTNDYHPPAHNYQPLCSEPQHFRARETRKGNRNSQPVLMGPPIRMGFSDGYLEGRQPLPPTDKPSFPHIKNESNARARMNRRDPSQSDRPDSSHSNRHSSPNRFSGQRGRGQKRGHSDAFGASKGGSVPKPQAAPAVPSFGGPLPTKPPVPQENGRKPRKKKKRRHNQLGLTPRTEEHESSEEEDDVDEESKLAAAVDMPTSERLSFTYRGQTSTLQSSSDIAAWIAERKKRFPTKARADENAKRKKEQQATDQLRREALNRQKSESRAQRSKEAKEAREKRSQEIKDSTDAVVKAKVKIEKLRKKLDKEQKLVRRAEEKAAEAIRSIGNEEDADQPSSRNTAGRKRKRATTKENTSDHTSQVQLEEPSREKSSETPYIKQEDVDKYDYATQAQLDAQTRKNSNDTLGVKEGSVTPIKLGLIEPAQVRIAPEAAEGKDLEAESATPGILTPTSQLSVPKQNFLPTDTTTASHTSDLPTLSDRRIEVIFDHTVPIDETIDDSSTSISASSSDLSSSEDDDDDSTSSGGSSSSSGDEAPETTTSTRTAPEKVHPPKRTRKLKSICRNFLQNGRCKRGEYCQFRHELPERGSHAKNKNKENKKAEGKKERIGLYQRLVEQEKEKEDLEALAAIVHLGEKGLLEENAPIENRGRIEDFIKFETEAHGEEKVQAEEKAHMEEESHIEVAE